MGTRMLDECDTGSGTPSDQLTGISTEETVTSEYALIDVKPESGVNSKVGVETKQMNVEKDAMVLVHQNPHQPQASGSMIGAKTKNFTTGGTLIVGVGSGLGDGQGLIDVSKKLREGNDSASNR